MDLFNFLYLFGFYWVFDCELLKVFRKTPQLCEGSNLISEFSLLLSIKDFTVFFFVKNKIIELCFFHSLTEKNRNKRKFNWYALKTFLKNLNDRWLCKENINIFITNKSRRLLSSSPSTQIPLMKDINAISGSERLFFKENHQFSYLNLKLFWYSFPPLK